MNIFSRLSSSTATSPYIATKHEADGHYTIAIMAPIEARPLKGIFIRPVGSDPKVRAKGSFSDFK